MRRILIFIMMILACSLLFGQIAEIKKTIPVNYKPLKFEKYYYESGIEIWIHCWNFSGAVLPDFEYILILFEKVNGKWKLTANYPWGPIFEKTGIKFRYFPDGTYPEGKIKNSTCLACWHSGCSWEQIYVRFIKDENDNIVFHGLTPYYR